MSKAKVQPGSYTAKIRDYFVDKTFHGHYRVNVSFNVQADGASHILTWSGSLSTPQSKALVIKALMVCGMKSASLLGSISKGRDSGVLNLNQEVLVEVVCEKKKAKDDPSKEYDWTSIKYINSLDGLAGRDRVQYDDFEAFVENTGMKDDFNRIQQEQGAPASDAPQGQQHDESNPPPMDYSSIPF